MAALAAPGKGAGVTTSGGIQPTYPATGAAAQKGAANGAMTLTQTEYRSDTTMQTDGCSKGH